MNHDIWIDLHEDLPHPIVYECSKFQPSWARDDFRNVRKARNVPIILSLSLRNGIKVVKLDHLITEIIGFVSFFLDGFL